MSCRHLRESRRAWRCRRWLCRESTSNRERTGSGGDGSRLRILSVTSPGGWERNPRFRSNVFFGAPANCSCNTRYRSYSGARRLPDCTSTFSGSLRSRSAEAESGVDDMVRMNVSFQTWDGLSMSSGFQTALYGPSASQVRAASLTLDKITIIVYLKSR